MVVPAPVFVDTAAAARALGAGRDALLILRPGATVDLPGLRRSGPGRAALFVGDPDDPDVVAAAIEMASEVFARRDPRSGGR